MAAQNKQNFPIALNQSLTLTYLLTSAACFLVPFSIGHNQLITGTVVNTGLFLAALYLPRPFILASVMFPSLAVLARGVIFGPLTPFLIIQLPFIWISNLLLVLIFQKLISMKKSYLLGVISSSVVKSVFIALSIWFLYQLKLVPKFFLTTMAVLQIVTALGGGAVSFIVKKSYYDRIS